MQVWVLVPPRQQLVIADGRRSPHSSDSPSPSRLVSYRVSAIEHGAGYWLSCAAALLPIPYGLTRSSLRLFRSVQTYSPSRGGGEKPDRADARTIFPLNSCGATQTRPARTSYVPPTLSIPGLTRTEGLTPVTRSPPAGDLAGDRPAPRTETRGPRS